MCRLLLSALVLGYLNYVPVNCQESPCPGTFEYRSDGFGVYGLIHLQPNGPISSIQVTANFTIAARLSSNYAGRLEPVNPSVLTTRPDSPIDYRVHFPVTSPLPRLTALVVNNKVLCYGSGDVPQPNLYLTTISLQHKLAVGGGQPGFNQGGFNQPSFNQPSFNQPDQYQPPRPRPQEPSYNAIGSSPNNDTQLFTFNVDDDRTGSWNLVPSFERPQQQKPRPPPPTPQPDYYEYTTSTRRPAPPPPRPPPPTPQPDYYEYTTSTRRPAPPPPRPPPPTPQPDYYEYTTSTRRPAPPPPRPPPPTPQPDYYEYTTSTRRPAPPPPRPPPPTPQPDYYEYTTSTRRPAPPPPRPPPPTPQPDYYEYTTSTRRPAPPPPRPPPPTPQPDYYEYTTSTRRPAPPPPRPETTYPSMPSRLPAEASSECGVVPEHAPLIYQGQGYTRGEWPWLVVMYKRKDGSLTFVCSGTLVSDRHVVTAAHCMKQRSVTTSIRDIVIKVGAHNLADWGDDIPVTRTLASATIHESYNSATLSDDLMVVTLDRSVEFNINIRPACLWAGNSDQSRIVGASGVVAGWGSSELGPGSKDEPRMVRMAVVSTSTCRASKPDFHLLTSNNTLCAGDRNGAGPCLGGGGGGMYLLEGGRWRLRGVVSLSLRADDGGTTCNLHEYFVFTDAAKYVQWIKNVMRD